MLAAVSPAVVLPVMIKLQKKGIGTSTGIPTLVIAVAGICDVLAVTGFEVVLGLIFSSGKEVSLDDLPPRSIVIIVLLLCM